MQGKLIGARERGGRAPTGTEEAAARNADLPAWLPKAKREVIVLRPEETLPNPQNGHQAPQGQPTRQQAASPFSGGRVRAPHQVQDHREQIVPGGRKCRRSVGGDPHAKQHQDAEGGGA